MPGTDLTARDAKDKRELQTGKTQQFTLHTFKRHIIEVEDLHFHHDSCVLLPDHVAYDATLDPPGEDRLTGLGIVALSYRHARDNPSQKLLIAGHTDTTGMGDYNVTLSRMRAKNIHAILMGTRDEWIKLCDDKHKTEDYKQILKWIATEWHWDCDPGAVNDEVDAATKRAIKNFQIRYNEEFEASIAESGIIDDDTWGGFFDMYMKSLREILKTDEAGVTSYRSGIHYLDSDHSAVGCGENFPIEKRGVDNYRSATNRRVELLFFEPGEEPKMVCHPSATSCVAKLCEVNNPKLYKPKHIPVTPIPPPPPKNVNVVLQLLYKDPEGKGRPFPEGMPATVQYSDGEKLTPVPKVAKNGILKFQARKMKRAFSICFPLEASPGFIAIPPKGSSDPDKFLKESEVEEHEKKEWAMFSLPRLPKDGKADSTWGLKVSDWKVEDAPHYKDFIFEDIDTIDEIGTDSAPGKMTLDPHWQYLQFEYFDRYYGHSDHSDSTISIPPIPVTGFREIPGKDKIADARLKAKSADEAEADVSTKRDLFFDAQDNNDKAEAEKAYADYLAEWWTNEKTAADANLLAHPGNAAAIKRQATATTEKTKKDADKAAKATAAANAATALTNATNAKNTAETAAAPKIKEATDARKAAELAAKDHKPDTMSSWAIEPGNDPKKRVQCLPWILWKSDAKKPDELTLIQFSFKEQHFIFSESAAVRKLVKLELPKDADKLKPGADRLRYYDLPTLWKSQQYYVRFGTSKKNRYEQLAKESTSADSPIRFCLDDIVLTNESHIPLPHHEWNPEKRAAILSHLFGNNKPDGSGGTYDTLTKEGLYHADDAAKLSFFSKLPSGTAAGTAGDDCVEKDRNYISDYPNWTRLVIANGNLFDVFGERTPESILDPVGARAAVRWIDATAPIPGATLIYEKLDTATKSFKDVNFTNQRPIPDRKFKNRPALIKKDYFAIQPFFEMRYADRGGAFDPGKDYGIGRFDMTLIRCCGLIGSGDSAKEQVINLHYLKSYFEFIKKPAPFHPPAAAGPDESPLTQVNKTEAEYMDELVANVNKRWNGYDTGKNESQAILVPRTIPAVQPTPPPLEVKIVWFGQALKREYSHFHVIVEDKRYYTQGSDGTWTLKDDARDNRGGGLGTGQSSPKGFEDSGSDNGFASAHECGHADGLPDEYNERWSGESFGQLSIKSNLPADPYEPDGRGYADPEYQTSDSGMMNGNQIPRNRYFWHCAEWARHVLESAPHPIKGALKVDYDKYHDYHLPPHPKRGEGQSYTYWPIGNLAGHAPPPPAPLPASRGKSDDYLFTMGEDRYTKFVLPSYEAVPPPADTVLYDGSLIIVVKIECTLPSFPPPADETSQRKTILRSMAGGVRRQLDNKYYLKGKVHTGKPEEWEFKRCLIHFAPQFVVTGVGDAANIIKSRGVHFKVEVVSGASASAEWINTPAAAELMSKADWITSSTVAGALRDDPVILSIDTDVESYHGIDAFDLIGRIKKLQNISHLCDQYVTQTNAKPQASHAQAYARIPAVHALKAQSDAKKSHLEKCASSNHLKIQYVDASMAVDVESHFSKNFPSMTGIYRTPAGIFETDIEKILGKQADGSIPALDMKNAEVLEI